MSLVTALLVALGAGFGSAARYAATCAADGKWPWGTMSVNVIGCVLLGAFSAMALGGNMLALLGAGFCGGLTTWSGLAVQTIDRGRWLGGAYLLLTLTLSMGGCIVAFWYGATHWN